VRASRARAKPNSLHTKGFRHVRQADDDVLLQVHHNDDGVLGYLFLKLPDAVHREMLIVLTSFLLF
jgi:hypothetical protein